MRFEGYLSGPADIAARRLVDDVQVSIKKERPQVGVRQVTVAGERGSDAENAKDSQDRQEREKSSRFLVRSLPRRTGCRFQFGW